MGGVSPTPSIPPFIGVIALKGLCHEMNVFSCGIFSLSKSKKQNYQQLYDQVHWMTKRTECRKKFSRNLPTILFLLYTSTLITGEKMQPAGFLVRVQKHLKEDHGYLIRHTNLKGPTGQIRSARE
jgi:hypothetical protein